MDVISEERMTRLECPNCHVTALWQDKCPCCGFGAATIGSFKAWAPELAQSNDGRFFNSDLFEALDDAESSNFWFLGRNELILWALKTYFGVSKRFMEIGCGTGFVLQGVENEFPATEIFGTELFVEGLKFAARRCARTKLVQLDARAIPYRAYFDSVGIFDVLEHIEEDEAVLAQIRESLVSGGGLLITVPQHRWLWSQVDEAACHVRRYSAEELARKVEGAGFEILRSTSFVSLLLPAMAAARLKSQKQTIDAAAGLHLNRGLNWLFRHAMAAEFHLIRRGINFVWGGSRLLVARKID